MEINDSKSPQGNMRHFTVMVVLAQVLGLAAVAMTAVWMGYYSGGFAWQSDMDVELEMNYHPLFMIIGMIFLYADAILAFRVFHSGRKAYIKVLHAGIHILVLVFAAVGLTTAVDMHNVQKIPNFFSYHSWLGLTTLIMFGLQWLIGFMSFLFPKLGLSAHIRVMPIHRFFGVVIFCMAVATALIGINELAFNRLEPAGYSQKPPVSILINSLGLVLVALAVLVIYIVSRPEYKRQPTADDENK